MEKRGLIFLAYFGACGTAWTFLRDFGIEKEIALVLVSLLAGVLIGMRIQVVLQLRRSRARAAELRSADPRLEQGRGTGSSVVDRRKAG